MSYLSRALDELMKDRGWSQVELERRTAEGPDGKGIAQSQISKYLNGAIPEKDVAERLFKPFAEDTPKLLVAFLKDCAPPKLLDTVVITTAESDHADSLQTSNLAILDRLPPRASTALTRLAAACERNPDMVTAVETILALAKQ